VSNLVPNAEVKVNDVTVGSVVASEATDWHAHLTVALDGVTRLPANATARVGQKSLLGAEYLELSAPTDQPPIGQLRDGDAIPLSRTGKYPETETCWRHCPLCSTAAGCSRSERSPRSSTRR